jgi:hypothetical protein
MTGTKETKVYSGKDGSVYRQDMLSGTQYHARTSIKGKLTGRYYATLSGAKKWLAKVNPPA